MIRTFLAKEVAPEFPKWEKAGASMPLHSPPVPDQMVMPHLWENVFLALVGIPALVALGWALRSWRRTGDPLYLVVLVGGTLCSLLEPLVDILGQCWYPRGAQFEVFELMGRPIPLFAVIGYTMMFGGYTLLTLEILKRKSPRSLWWVWLGGIFFTAIFEFFATHTGSYAYYGDQPLRIFSWPSWWGPVNSLVAMVCAVFITVLRPHLRGWRVLVVAVLIPVFDGAVNAAAAWPVYTTNWSDVPPIARQLSGVATFAISALLLGLLIAIAEHGVRPISSNTQSYNDLPPVRPEPKESPR